MPQEDGEEHSPLVSGRWASDQEQPGFRHGSTLLSEWLGQDLSFAASILQATGGNCCMVAGL